MTCRVVLCDDGAEAISVCTDLQPDLLLLDVSMPVMDGLTALPRIREVSPSTNVVMLSGFSSESMKRQALELGACRFIEKGVPPVELTGQLRAQCT